MESHCYKYSMHHRILSPMLGFYSPGQTLVVAIAICHQSISRVGRQVAVAPGGYGASGGAICVSDQPLIVLAATIEKYRDDKYRIGADCVVSVGADGVDCVVSGSVKVLVLED
ncbi:hypothetical protein Patl1_04081 [Pistacia atlantica]|uniref:Uncharacterized protein n=1 Tax=Pistacia atlantica TaxID=434234 RepID=A0ACC1BPW8_9ROSI|nr:hypothetical protein Patl1_04081 [Pistacia atlantica]